jgi:hypothetical protein
MLNRPRNHFILITILALVLLMAEVLIAHLVS